MFKKRLYETPETELLVVKFEENFLDGSLTGGAKNVQKATEDDDWGEF